MTLFYEASETDEDRDIFKKVLDKFFGGKVDRGRLRFLEGWSEWKERLRMGFNLKNITIDDYDQIYELWCSDEFSKRALYPVDDTREGIEKYLKRNPNTCFLMTEDEKVIGVILAGHDGRRGIIHHLCVHPDYRRRGIAGALLAAAEEALADEGINKVFGLVFKDNESANAFWERCNYTLRTNLNYRNKSMHHEIPAGD